MILIASIVGGIVVVALAIVFVLQSDKFAFATSLEGQRGALETEIQLRKKELEGLAEERQEIDRWRRDRVAMETEVDSLKASKKSLEDDIRLLEPRAATHQNELDQKIQLLQEKEQELQAAEEKLAGLVSGLEEAEKKLEAAVERRTEIEAELEGLREAAGELEEALEQKRAEAGDIEKEIDDAKARFEEAQGDLDKKLQEIEDKDQELREKRLEAGALGSSVAAAGAAGGSRLLDPSAFDELKVPYVKEGPGGEREVQFQADEFVEQLKREGFHFSERLIKAFHTSLMVQDISSLTVMAGVSGTGKTTLPKQYAKYMGMHFLLLPVEPRWDSPQDLFGFMNYLEGRYVATELGRALRQFDIVDGDMKDRMLLVLLDEMNLARVEYYFSEFLSRLEMKRTVGDWAQVERDDDDYRLTSMEIYSGQGQKESDEPEVPKIAPIRLLAGPNVLFVGTMNEDETTNTLSDKVNDRSNVIRFGMPEKLTSKGGGESADERAAEEGSWLAYGSWAAAVEKAQSGSEDDSAIRQYVEALNKKFGEAGKHFGHRPYEATLRYIKSHPDGRLDTQVDNPPLADQVAMRFLPRLNGLDLGECSDMLNGLNGVRDLVIELNDQAVMDAFEEATNQSKRSVFQWPGINWDRELDG